MTSNPENRFRNSGGGKRPSYEVPRDELIFSEPYLFEFFQAVRLLERMFPEKRFVGRDESPASEVVRFRSHPSLSFPPSELVDVKAPSPGTDGQVEMTVAFAGLIGPSGALPVPYTELVMERRRYRDTALWVFLDLFHHRLVSLFYRAWEKYRFPVAFERDQSDPFTGYLFSLIGMGTGGLRGRMDLEDTGLLLYSGLIAQRPHSSIAVESILNDYFGVPAAIVQFIGEWHKLEPASLSRMGEQNCELGVNLIAGSEVLVRQSKFRVRLGPLWLNEFITFLPAGRLLKPLFQLTRFLVGIEFDFDVQLVLKKEEVPMCQLSSKARLLPMLGWTTWIRTEEMKEDVSDVVFNCND